MAGSGVALRLYEFRESQDSRDRDGPNTTAINPSRVGRDVNGLYPGQLGRVHVVHSKDYGSAPYRRSRPLLESLQPSDPQSKTYQDSFDLLTLRALVVLHHSPAALEQRPPQTVYQEHFGLQAPLHPETIQ